MHAEKSPRESDRRPAMSESKTTAPRARQAGGEPAPKRKRIDWEAVERDYRTGRFTLRELEAKHGPNNATIGRRAEREGWTKDLADAIRQATNAKLIAATTQQECSSAQQSAATTVLAAAEIGKQVILGQRSRVGQAIEVSMRMLAELDTTTTRADEIGAMFERVTEDMDSQSMAAVQAQFREFMRLHSRVSSAQKLMDALGKAQTLERQAFSLDDPNKPQAPRSVYESDDDELLAEILADRAARRAA
jgi:hypothetical protein